MTKARFIEKKREKGQFFTIQNPFTHPQFLRWVSLIPKSSIPWLEPFAGSNNILSLLEQSQVRKATHSLWTCYDLEPVVDDRNQTSVHIQQRDTLESFPKEYPVVVTNPPYLARNSATRRKIDFPQTPYDDVYKHALHTMLTHTPWIAAIIPESFITCRDITLKQRLWSVISLNCEMFQDTEVPVCLALFHKEPTSDFTLWQSDGSYIGTHQELKCLNQLTSFPISLKFNDPEGSLGLYACDNHKEPSIRFVDGKEIQAQRIKGTSRAITRISGLDSFDYPLDLFISHLNQTLNQWRQDTFDVFLTSFKGLRDDGRYRRRLDWTNASRLIKHTLSECCKDMMLTL